MKNNPNQIRAFRNKTLFIRLLRLTKYTVSKSKLEPLDNIPYLLTPRVIDSNYVFYVKNTKKTKALNILKTKRP